MAREAIPVIHKRRWAYFNPPDRPGEQHAICLGRHAGRMAYYWSEVTCLRCRAAMPARTALRKLGFEGAG